MKKIIILIGMIVLMTVGVLAFTVGNNISQQQLNNLDLDNLDLSNGFLRDENNKVVYECSTFFYTKACWVYGNFTTIKPNYNEDRDIIDYTSSYKLVRISFDAKKYHNIKTEHNLTYARSELKDFLQKRYAFEDKKNTNKLKRYQLDPYNIDDIMDGLDLS